MFNKKYICGLIFLVYMIVRVTLNIPAIFKPRELADSVGYLRISEESVSDGKFWTESRTSIFPFLLKISNQDTSVAAAIQLGFSIFAWGFLALIMSLSFRQSYLRFFSFTVILLLSLVRHLASWDYIMLTESLSISFFVLFLALGVWLVQGWHIYKIVFLLITGVFLAFTRDTNAYLLLMLAGMLTLAILFGWIRPRVFPLVLFFVSTFFLANYTSNQGERWLFPLNNIVTARVIVDSENLKYFESCGMVATPELLKLAHTFGNIQDRNDPALNDYRVWLRRYGKSCYMKWLLSNPIRSVGEPLTQFETLVRYDRLADDFARKYDPVIPYFAEPFIYPVKFILSLWIVLTVVAFFTLWKRAWKINPFWGIYILLCLTILPNLFITWHGDAMAPERHALSAGLQLALSFWMAIFLLLDQFVKLRKNE
ncbi:MAG: hypothetical protein HY864_13895 [Chloroflexi bacterium]|nr:hypothetical protein [Chloroflexota bacterium]